MRIIKDVPSSSHLAAGKTGKEHAFLEAIHSAGKHTLLTILPKLSTSTPNGATVDSSYSTGKVTMMQEHCKITQKKRVLFLGLTSIRVIQIQLWLDVAKAYLLLGWTFFR